MDISMISAGFRGPSRASLEIWSISKLGTAFEAKDQVLDRLWKVACWYQLLVIKHKCRSKVVIDTRMSIQCSVHLPIHDDPLLFSIHACIFVWDTGCRIRRTSSGNPGKVDGPRVRPFDIGCSYKGFGEWGLRLLCSSSAYSS